VILGAAALLLGHELGLPWSHAFGVSVATISQKRRCWTATKVRKTGWMQGQGLDAYLYDIW